MHTLPHITIIVGGQPESDGFTLTFGKNGSVNIDGLPDGVPPSPVPPETEGAAPSAKHAAHASAYEDFKNAAYIVKQAAQIRDPKLRKAAILAAGEYFIGEAASEILGPSGNVIAIF